MKKTATHIIRFNKSQNQDDLYRASDGMLIASRQGEIVRIGAEPKEVGNRFFIDWEHAAAFIRKVPGMDMFVRKSGRLNLTDVTERTDLNEPFIIDEQNIEATLIIPAGNVVQVLKH